MAPAWWCRFVTDFRLFDMVMHNVRYLLDLEALDMQRAERFVDPIALHRAVNSALISFDLPTAGAYLRPGLSIRDSWRECIDRIFRHKRIEVNRLNQSLLQLLFLLHGSPGHPADFRFGDVSPAGMYSRDVPVGPSGLECPVCGFLLLPTDTLRIHEEVVEDNSNESPLSRLMQVVELLVLVDSRRCFGRRLVILCCDRRCSWQTALWQCMDPRQSCVPER